MIEPVRWKHCPSHEERHVPRRISTVVCRLLLRLYELCRHVGEELMTRLSLVESDHYCFSLGGELQLLLLSHNLRLTNQGTMASFFSGPVLVRL